MKGFGLENNRQNRKDMGFFATAAAMPERIPSEKQCILPRGRSVQYPLRGISVVCAGKLLDPAIIR
jgi:hypothetical protein